MRSSVVKKLKICGRGEELKFSGGRKKKGGGARQEIIVLIPLAISPDMESFNGQN